MEYIKVTNENIEKEHICCAISNNNDIQVSSKKAWLSERFEDGLVFLKSTARGECCIEYIPAENAWNPISADGYLYIDCLWGKFPSSKRQHGDRWQNTIITGAFLSRCRRGITAGRGGK